MLGMILLDRSKAQAVLSTKPLAVTDMPEIKTTQKERDTMADVVLARYRRARDYRRSYVLFQQRSVDGLMTRAEHQFNREYTNRDAASMTDAFGFCPSRYYGLVNQKVTAGLAWKTDLVLLGLDSMFTVRPTPEPEIGVSMRKRIRTNLERELVMRMAEAGVADPDMLLTPDGAVAKPVQAWLEQQADALRKVEQARVAGAATAGADRMQRRMRDILLQGDFRRAYMSFSHDQILHGRGVMRFPKAVRKPHLQHTSSGMKYGWRTVPQFQNVPVQQFYAVDDSDTLTTNTGNTERTDVSRAALIAAADQKGYYRDQIEKIIAEFEYKSRNWLDPDDQERHDDVWWGLDETIPILIHEGFFSGDELAEHGISGVDSMEYVSARVEVCGGRTIKCDLIEQPYGGGRSYYQASHVRTGTGLYDSVGMAALLWDSEQRINRMMHIFEHNLDWAARPPILKNKNAFDNPLDANNISPGGQYEVEERFGVTGSMPDSLRTMNTTSAQYHLIMTQINAILTQADAESGLPSYAYTGTNFGESSLGEYTQRMSNALRAIKMLAIREDMDFIEPAFHGLFEQEVLIDKDLQIGQDVDLVIRGMTGLLKEDVTQQKQRSLLPLLVNGGQSGLVPQEATNYAVYQLLSQAGFPMDALGISDPVLENALSVAADRPVETAGAATQQVPTVDGRSGPIPSTNVAQPNGMSNLTQTAPRAGS